MANLGIKAIANHSAESIRYKDVMDYVSDDFRNRDFQRPFFVTQADYTEIFCDVTEPLKNLLANYIQTETESSPRLLTPEKASMVDLLKEDAKRFCSKEEAHEVLTAIIEQINEKLTSHSEIPILYEISVTPEEKNPPEPRSGARRKSMPVLLHDHRPSVNWSALMAAGKLRAGVWRWSNPSGNRKFACREIDRANTLDRVHGHIQ